MKNLRDTNLLIGLMIGTQLIFWGIMWIVIKVANKLRLTDKDTQWLEAKFKELGMS